MSPSCHLKISKQTPMYVCMSCFRCALFEDDEPKPKRSRNGWKAGSPSFSCESISFFDGDDDDDLRDAVDGALLLLLFPQVLLLPTQLWLSFVLSSLPGPRLRSSRERTTGSPRQPRSSRQCTCFLRGGRRWRQVTRCLSAVAVCVLVLQADNTSACSRGVGEKESHGALLFLRVAKKGVVTSSSQAAGKKGGSKGLASPVFGPLFLYVCHSCGGGHVNDDDDGDRNLIGRGEGRTHTQKEGTVSKHSGLKGRMWNF